MWLWKARKSRLSAHANGESVPHATAHALHSPLTPHLKRRWPNPHPHATHTVNKKTSNIVMPRPPRPLWSLNTARGFSISSAISSKRKPGPFRAVSPPTVRCCAAAAVARLPPSLSTDPHVHVARNRSASLPPRRQVSRWAGCCC